MPNYEDLGLTPNFQSINSLAQKSLSIKGSDFDLEQDRSIITESKIGSGVIRTVNIQDAAITNAKIGTAVIGTANIGTLSFNEISGGTAILGGTSNGNGVLSLRNQSGSEVVKLDNTGMTVTNGSIIIQDSSGSNIIDSAGLVSTNNFQFGGSSNLTLRSTTSSFYGTVPNTTLNIVLSREANILLTAIVQARVTAGTRITTPVASDVQMQLNGTNVAGPTMNLLDDQRANTYFGVYTTAIYTMSRQVIKNVASGTNTYCLVYKTDAEPGGGTLDVLATEVNYLVFGK